LILSVSCANFNIYEYALTFNTIPVGNVNHGVASSQLRDNNFHESGPKYHVFSTAEEASAVWLSEVTSYANGTFSEAGNITFGSVDNLIFFQSRVLGTAQGLPGVGYGSISYEITNGTGIFKGAKGWMVDIFVAFDDRPSFDINAWGWFYVSHSMSHANIPTPKNQETQNDLLSIKKNIQKKSPPKKKSNTTR